MASLGERLRQVMKDMELSEGELARRSGLKQPTIHRILNGQSKDPRQSNVERIASAIGRTASWLRTGKEDKVSGYANVNQVPPSQQVYRYPVVSWVAAGGWNEAVVPYEPGCEQSFETTDYRPTGTGTPFWLEVQGDSMTAQNGFSIPQGMLILVDPDVEAVNGSLVVAHMDNASEATFKKLVIDGGQMYLKPLNPAYPVITVDNNCEIVGVVVEAKMKFGLSQH